MIFSEQNDDGYIKSYEYDKNWDLLKYNEGNNSHWTYNYQSYDSFVIGYNSWQLREIMMGKLYKQKNLPGI